MQSASRAALVECLCAGMWRHTGLLCNRHTIYILKLEMYTEEIVLWKAEPGKYTVRNYRRHGVRRAAYVT